VGLVGLVELVGSFVFAAVLAACALGLMLWHVRSWRAALRRPPEPAELEFLRRQYRRRMQSSLLLGLLAISLPLGHWFLLKQWSKVGALYWGLVLLVLAWVGVLAVADIWATKFFFGRLRDRYRLEQTRLQAQLRQIRRTREAGKSNGDPRKERD
jgi:hypothetical protein